MVSDGRRFGGGLEKVAFHFLRQTAAVPIGILVRDHAGLRMTGIALYSLDISVAQYQLEAGTGMAKCV